MTRSLPSRLARHEIVEVAARHALAVHEDPLNPPLTPWGIATCAASCAHVLTDRDHPNHEITLSRLMRTSRRRDDAY